MVKCGGDESHNKKGTEMVAQQKPPRYGTYQQARDGRRKT
jgi:hypothetical protein